MKATSRLRFPALAFSLATSFATAGCWYDDFEEWDGTTNTASGGSVNTGDGDGSGGTSDVDGTGGDNTAGDVLSAEAISQDMLQAGDALIIDVLEVVKGEGVKLTSTSDVHLTRPSVLDAQIDLDFEEGTVRFAPDPRFWGNYPFSVTVTDAAGETLDVSISVRVVPTSLRLETIELGWGGFIIDGAIDDELGTSLSGVGDFDGDGIDDLLLGAPGHELGRGRGVLVSGRAQGNDGLEVLEDINLSSGDPSTGVLSILGDNVNKRAGISVSEGGDVNGDGVADLIIGASQAPQDGRAYVLYGANSARSAPVALSDTMSAGFTMTGPSASRAGSIVRGAGDINGDGMGDLLVYAVPSDDTIYGVFGSDSGANTSGTLTSLADLTFTHSNTHDPGAFLSETLTSAGVLFPDADSDRAGVLFAQQTGSNLRVGVLRGTGSSWPANVSAINQPTNGWITPAMSGTPGTSLASAGQFDGRLGEDVAHCNRTTCRIVTSTETPEAFDLNIGTSVQLFSGADAPRVAGGGDINGDGLDDLLFAEDGEAYVVWGRDSLPSEIRSSDLDDFGIQLANDDATIKKIAIIGDINGDGLDDFALSNPEFGSDNGRIYVVFGFASE